VTRCAKCRRRMWFGRLRPPEKLDRSLIHIAQIAPVRRAVQLMKICDDCWQRNVDVDHSRNYWNRREVADLICLEWLKDAPIIHDQRVIDSANTSKPGSPWVEDLEAFARACASSLMIGGGFPANGQNPRHPFRFERSYSTDLDILLLLADPHADALLQNDSPGNDYHWYHGSVFRTAGSAPSVVVTWTSGRSGSYG
jgi:hypothetical protein